MNRKPDTDKIETMLRARALPWQHRAGMLRNLLENITPDTQGLVQRIIQGLEGQQDASVLREKTEQVEALLRALQAGPMRQGLFIELAPKNGCPVQHALVSLDDGTLAYAVVPYEEEAAAATMRRGDPVLLGSNGGTLLRSAPTVLKTGYEARFERRIDDRHIEVAGQNDEHRVILATQQLQEQIDAGEVAPGATLLFNPRQAMALAALPAQDELSHFRFLDKGGVPEVIVERDIGAPPKVIAEVTEHIRQELLHPEPRRRYKLRRCMTRLLCGVSGSGKTLAIQAIHRLMYEIMSQLTGVPTKQLPPRVFRFRQSQMLSMWLGESDKNIDRLFDEIELLADQEFVAPDGRRYALPVLAILEEADGLGRARGQEAIYDRIMTTALQRLDPDREGLKDKLVVFLATTNEPQILDAAFLRRIGASIETFGRLNRKSFMAVLQKHLQGLPAASNNGCTQEQLRQRLVQDVTAWLFSPNGTDPGLIELTFAGSTTPTVKHRRDFLTGSLVGRAVQQAATEACRAECRGQGSPGLTLEQLVCAFDAQLRSIADQLREQNVGHYADLPDGVRVASLRRIPQPTYLPIQLQLS